MDHHQHGDVTASRQDRQTGNTSWWTFNTMSYDWKDKSGLVKYSREWFDDIDARFLHGARLFSSATNPFEALMNVGSLSGKRVLEIGCGMGMHTEMLLRAGAELTSIDISPTSVMATTERLKVKGLHGDVQQMDAEHLAFSDSEFDLVWSWGVIHHSARTGLVLKEIARVVKPGGTVRLMVYNLEGMSAYATIAKTYLWQFWRKGSLDEALWNDSDGYTARYYTRDLWNDLLAIFFERTEIAVYGQDADAAPLPRRLRPALLKLMSPDRQRALAAKRGSMLFSVSFKAA